MLQPAHGKNPRIKHKEFIMSGKVTVYSTATCPHCSRLKEFLKNNNVSFENIDVGSDPAKADDMVKKSGQMGVPVVDIDGDIIVGFDRDAIQEKLGI
jgi:glutaredoxin 3